MTAAVSIVTAWVTFQVVKRAEIRETIAAELEKQQALMRQSLERDRDERLRIETLRWANPILGAEKSLSKRLDNILIGDGYLALSEQGLWDRHWSVTYDYFMQSTLFEFAQYFASIERFKQEMSFELFRKGVPDKDHLIDRIDAVAGSLSDFPRDGVCKENDAQVFTLQQRAMGDLLSADASGKLISFAEFGERIQAPRYKRTFEPLRRLLKDVTPEDCRWARLQLCRTALKDIAQTCEELLSPGRR